MNLVGIDAIVHGVHDVDAALRFHDDWGFETLERGASGVDFALTDGTTVHVRRADDPAPPPVQATRAARSGQQRCVGEHEADSAESADVIRWHQTR